MANEIVEKKKTMSDVLAERLLSEQSALPQVFNSDRFKLNAISYLNDHAKDLEGVKPTSIVTGLMKGAVMGLDFYNKECYLVKYGDSANFMLDYRGCIKLAKKYSVRPIKEIDAKLVREGDEFSTRIENNETLITYKPIPFNEGKIIGAFAYVLFTDGGCLVDTMSKSELDMTRSKSKAGNAMAWRDFPGEMYRKTVLHRITKKISLDWENPNQISIFDDDVAIDTRPVKKKTDNPFDDVEVVEGTVVDVSDEPMPDCFK